MWTHPSCVKFSGHVVLAVPHLGLTLTCLGPQALGLQKFSNELGELWKRVGAIVPQIRPNSPVLVPD